jgi:hypothetical protein
MTERLAMTTGIVGLLALVLLILFFTVGGPFGTLNDICNGLTGFLSGVLAWSLYMKLRIQPIFLLLSSIGALTVALGSVLIIFDVTGWYLAGLYTSAGYALIGLWLLALNYSACPSNLGPHGLNNLGMIAGIIMALGLLMIPGIINRIDAWEAGPWYINYVGQLGSIGYFMLYPIWCILIGRALLLE